MCKKYNYGLEVTSQKKLLKVEKCFIFTQLRDLKVDDMRPAENVACILQTRLIMMSVLDSSGAVDFVYSGN